MTFLLGAATAVPSWSPAQVTSQIVGYTRLHLLEGTNFIGFALLPVMELQTSFTIPGADRRVISLQGNVTLMDDQFSPGPLATHVVEVMLGGVALSVVTDTAAAGNQLTLEQPLPAEVSDGASVKVWRMWRLGDVFGETNSAGLTSGTSPATSDLILLPNGTDFDRYFYSSGGDQGVGWRLVGGGTVDQSDVPIFPTEGMAIRALASKTVQVVGQVKPGATQVRLETGYNYVANLCPVSAGGDQPSPLGRTLGNSGLAAGLAGAAASSNADLVLFWNGTGYDQFYHSTGGLAGAGWRKVGSGRADQAAAPLPDGAFIILRRGNPVAVALSQGNF